MTFQPGNSGNPAGRPKGITDKRTKLRGLLEVHAEEIITKLAELAKSGEPNALRLCVERLLPKSRLEDCVYFELPEGRLDSSDNMIQIAYELTQAVISGQLTIQEAQKFSIFLCHQSNRINIAEKQKQEEIERKERVAAWKKNNPN